MLTQSQYSWGAGACLSKDALQGQGLRPAKGRRFGLVAGALV